MSRRQESDFLFSPMYLYLFIPVAIPPPECIIGQISWNSVGRILIKKVHFEIEGAGYQILKIISEDYYKNITDIDLEFNVQLSTSIYIDCIALLFN